MPKQRVFEKIKSFVTDSSLKVRKIIIDIAKMRGGEIPETATIKECVDGLLEVMNQSGNCHPDDGTATAGDILSGEKAYSKDGAIIGTIQRKNAQTYTPGTVDQTIAAGQYLSGNQTVKGDANLKPENIIKGKTIFGVAGNAEGVDMSDATATADDIVSPYTAYNNGGKITGNIQAVQSKTYTPGTADKIIAAGQYLAGTQTVKGDANLTAGNIAKGKSIFGVTGTCDAQTFYQCTSVSGGTWSGKKLVLGDDGYYSIADAVTSGLTYSGFTPKVGNVYNADTTIYVDKFLNRYGTVANIVYSSYSCPINPEGYESGDYIISASSELTDNQSDTRTAYAAFYDRDVEYEADGWHEGLYVELPQWVQWQNKNEKVLVNAYSLRNANRWDNSALLFEWELQGSDNGVDWTVIDHVDKWEETECRSIIHRALTNITPYYYHRIYIKQTNDGSGGYSTIGLIRAGVGVGTPFA